MAASSYESYLYMGINRFGYFWFRFFNPNNSERVAFVVCPIMTGLHLFCAMRMVIHLDFLFFLLIQKVHVALCSKTSLNALKHRGFS